MYYVYILRSEKTKQFYTGYSHDLKKRLEEHNSGKSKYTSTHRPYELIYYEASCNKEDAMAREKYLKSGMGKRYLNNRMKRYLEDTTEGSK